MTTPATPRNSNRHPAPATSSLAGRVSFRDRAGHGQPAHPVLVGDRKYLRALRAAEMAAWNRGVLLRKHDIRIAPEGNEP